MIKLCCDICGKELNEDKDAYTTVSVSDYSQPNEPIEDITELKENYKRYDLCSECAEKVKKTLTFMMN